MASPATTDTYLDTDTEEDTIWDMHDFRSRPGKVAGVVEVDSPVYGHSAELHTMFVQQTAGFACTFLLSVTLIVLLMVSKQRSEKEVRKLALVAAKTGNAVAISNSLGFVEWVNDGFVRITGRQTAEAIGKDICTVLCASNADPEEAQKIREQMRKGQAFRTETLNHRKDGPAYWMNLEIQPIKDFRGRLTHLMVIGEDITLRKTAEDALQSELRMRLIVDNRWTRW